MSPLLVAAVFVNTALPTAAPPAAAPPTSAPPATAPPEEVQPGDITRTDPDLSVPGRPASATQPAASNGGVAPLSLGLASLSLEYADHLFGDGDYYRAITEYRRYLYLTRGVGGEAPRSALAIGEAYLRARQFEAAAAQFESVAARSDSAETRAVALVSAGRAHLLGDRPLLATGRLAEAGQVAVPGSPAASEAAYLAGWALLARRDWAGAGSLFSEVAAGAGPRAASARAILEHLGKREELGGKNPLVAGALSFIPGLGHMYLGQWSVGFAALFWNALFIFATGYSIWTQEWGVAAVLGVFELSWFSGTMFGALNGALRHNSDAVSNWLDDLHGELGAERELGPVTGALGHPGDLHRLLLPRPGPKSMGR